MAVILAVMVKQLSLQELTGARRVTVRSEVVRARVPVPVCNDDGKMIRLNEGSIKAEIMEMADACLKKAEFCQGLKNQTDMEF